MSKLLTIAEVAERLRLSKATVYELVRRGQLIALRVGVGRGVIRIDDGELARYESQSTVVSPERKAKRQAPTRVRLKHMRLGS